MHVGPCPEEQALSPAYTHSASADQASNNSINQAPMTLHTTLDRLNKNKPTTPHGSRLFPSPLSNGASTRRGPPARPVSKGAQLPLLGAWGAGTSPVVVSVAGLRPGRSWPGAPRHS